MTYWHLSLIYDTTVHYQMCLIMEFTLAYLGEAGKSHVHIRKERGVMRDWGRRKARREAGLPLV